MGLARWIRTLAHLRARQVLAQVRVRLRRWVEDPARLRASLPEDGELPPVHWAWLDSVALPHADGVAISNEDARAGRFTFLGETRELDRPIRWRDEAAPRLWRYHLQDHAFVLGLDFETAREIVLEYLAGQPPARKAEGWEPYPLSLRITHWVCAFFGRWRKETLADEEFAKRLWLELRRMGTWLERHPETHLLANHLLENAIALALFGACFGGELAGRLGNSGRAWLIEELEEQILADGGHVERSPMYQQRILYALTLLLHSGDGELRTLVEPRAARMLGWLEALTHPDGGIALFNDAGLRVYPRTEVLAGWLAALGVEGQRAHATGAGWSALVESGYFSARNSAGDAFFLDAGEIGPDYQPGHAHADFLSIELSLGGHRFVVDGGNPDYVDSPARRWARGVEAHSTVFVQGEQPLELWGAFRVGRRGRPSEVVYGETQDGAFEVRAAHTGYRHLPGGPMPERHATWTPEGLLRLEDRVVSSRAAACISQLRVDGAWHPERKGPGRVRFEREGEVAWVIADGELELIADRCFPTFGPSVPAWLLRRPFVAGLNRARWTVGHERVFDRQGEVR